jgi:hypothetical protein
MLSPQLRISGFIVAAAAMLSISAISLAADANSASARQQSCSKMQSRAAVHPSAAAKPIDHAHMLDEVVPDLDVSVTHQVKTYSHINYLVFLDDERIGVLYENGYKQDSNVFREPGSKHPLTVRGYGEYGSVEITIPETDCDSLSVDVPLKNKPVKMAKSHIEITGLENGVFKLGTPRLIVTLTDTARQKTVDFNDWTYSVLVYDQLNRPFKLSSVSGNPQDFKSQLWIQLQRGLEINPSFFSTDSHPPFRLVIHLLTNDGNEYEASQAFTVQGDSSSSLAHQILSTRFGQVIHADSCVQDCFIDFLAKNATPASSSFKLGQAASEACDAQIAVLVAAELGDDHRPQSIEERHGIKVDASDLRVKDLRTLTATEVRQVHLNCQLDPH